MLRYLKHRRYLLSRRSKAVFLLVFAISFILLVKFRTINSPKETWPRKHSRKPTGNEEREIRKLTHLTVREQFNKTHFYTIIRFNNLKSDRQSRDRNFRKGSKYWYFLPKFKVRRTQAPSWFFDNETFCQGCFVSYGKRAAYIKDVVIDPSFAENVRGGEPLETVYNQSAESEYLHLSKGYFYLTTNNEIPHYKDTQIMYDFKVLLDALTVDNVKLTADKVIHKTTVATIRHEYANLYHTMMNWYDTFILMVLFHIDPSRVHILWLDSHPKSQLDETWKTLYGDVEQARAIKEPTLYKNMVWDAIGATCPLNQHAADSLPYSEKFRHFVLLQHQTADDHEIDCQHLHISFIFRHKYTAHPRNPNGFMTRKIKNENEVIEVLGKAMPEDNISRVMMENLSMKEQLKIISGTDILIGMHGAGLSHVLFLPSTSGVIELLPHYVSPANKHFQAMAKWRQLSYIMWRNEDPHLEKKDHYTVVPPDLLVDMVRKMKILLCGDFYDKIASNLSEDARFTVENIPYLYPEDKRYKG